jgi:hypothetical protein
MKVAGSILFCLVTTGALAAESAGLSDRLKAVIRADLPVYAPPRDTAKTASAAATSPDPDVLELPKLTVREKRLPRGDPDLWRSEREIQQRAMRAYRNSMTPLEWALNSWFVPLFSAPASVRARAAYQDSKLAAELDLIARVAEVAKLTDPKAPAAIKAAVDNMQRADERQNRPAGDK